MQVITSITIEGKREREKEKERQGAASAVSHTGSVTGNFSNTFCDRECSTPIW